MGLILVNLFLVKFMAEVSHAKKLAVLASLVETIQSGIWTHIGIRQKVLKTHFLATMRKSQ